MTGVELVDLAYPLGPSHGHLVTPSSACFACHSVRKESVVNQHSESVILAAVTN